MTRPRRRAATLGLVAAGALALLGLALVQGKPEPADDPEAAARGAVRAGRGLVVRSVTYQGRVAGGRQVTLLSEFDAHVAQVHVAYGTNVAADQPLVTFDPGDVERQSERLRAQQQADSLWLKEYYPTALDGERLGQARLEAQAGKAVAEARARVTALERGVTQQLATADELAAAQRALADLERDADALRAEGQLKLQRLEQQRLEREQGLRNATSSLKGLDQQSRRYRLVAPFAGLVTGINEVLLGGRSVPVRRDTYLLTLSETGAQVVETAVPPGDLPFFATHREMRCHARKSDVRASCTVTGVQKAGDAAQFVVRLRVEGATAPLEIGEAVTLTRVLESRDAPVTLPLGALRMLDDRRIGVLQREGTAVRFVPVEIGLRGDETVEIVRGLKAGDVVELAADASPPR